ncbi:phosphatidylinositol 3,4,5-trisphosphate 3-phosphatase and protein-tyrosine-phosphatase PTEN2A-like [Andrographis paniculata]|uniref:phosphatidylinositol 3,4,5-trisphosphate 3-phosphatase and protein-tyrosine-phosphatase PTEN2A-like n=1 Tax=Andrographis paniculata TaxID=175694 RepID=UPI0021E80A2C|nr:phosphatidylinositol 3,4,5-trisphosphate 3-phosphatase and protein-tyrosine-phosphatase PTEN2A-like [Andrographis paniculata]
MESETVKSSPSQPDKGSDVGSPPTSDFEREHPAHGSSSTLSTTALSWARSLKFSQKQQDSPSINDEKLTFSRLASGLGLQFPNKAPNDSNDSAPAQSSVVESLTKGIVDTSLNAVKAVQVKARHIVSQNKRRYQEGGFDLDMTYITENIIAMGFPAGDLSSGLFGYFEGLYRNHMEEVIKFFETHHKGKYKVYNLCSERLYDASLFEGKVASFPFDDHNCPPIHLIKLFCQSAYSWLKEDIVNVVVVHCKAGKARTGLMICSLLLFLKFFPTAEECIDYYNQKRCVDGKGLILPSQIRYVKYFERILTQFNGETPPGRRCMLRGFRLHNCPYWVRPAITISNHNGLLFSTKKHPKTKNLMPEDFWIRANKKGIVVFALPGEPGLTELIGDFKIHFHDGHGDFYCWLNTTMMENRVILDASGLDGFDNRKLPSPGFQVEIVMIDYGGTIPAKTKSDSDTKGAEGKPGDSSSSSQRKADSQANKASSKPDNEDDVFSDSEGEETDPSRSSTSHAISISGPARHSESSSKTDSVSTITHQTEQPANSQQQPIHGHEMKIDDVKSPPNLPSFDPTDIKAIAADASVFSFGDDEDYESE